MRNINQCVSCHFALIWVQKYNFILIFERIGQNNATEKYRKQTLLLAFIDDVDAGSSENRSYDIFPSERFAKAKA